MTNSNSYILQGGDVPKSSFMSGNFKQFPGFIPTDIAEGFIASTAPRTAPVFAKVQDNLDGEGRYVECNNRKAIVIPGFDNNVTYIGANSFTPHDPVQHIADPLSRYVAASGGDIGYLQVAAINGGGRVMAQIGKLEPYSTSSGVKYHCTMTALGGHDGKTASYFDPGMPTIFFCQNQVPSLSERANAQNLRVRHSRYSLDRMAEVTNLGGELDAKAEATGYKIEALIGTRFNDEAFEKLLVKLFPQPEPTEKDEKKAAVTRWENTTRAVRNLWRNDERAATWHGTAFGAFQAVNTYQLHEAPVRGADRATRTLENLTSGKQMDVDLNTLATIRTLAYA